MFPPFSVCERESDSEQLVELVLLPCGFWVLNSGRLTLQQAPFLNDLFLMCVCIDVHTCHSIHMEVREQLLVPLWVLGIKLR